MKEEIKKKLEEMDKDRQENSNAYWTISRKTGEFLNKTIRDRNFKTVLEVGTSIGYSGIWIAEALTHTGGKLYTIESHDERFLLAHENFKEAGLLPYIEQLKGHAPDIEINDMFDMLFLDATKIEHLSYVTTYLFHMKKGGLIITDNAVSHAEQLKQYKEYVFNSKQLKSELKEIGTGLFISEII